MTEDPRDARAGAYRLLAELLEWGPSEATREAAATSPILAAALRGESRDDLDAAHTAAFGIQVFPYAGVFLHPSAQAGADALPLLEAYRDAGFFVETSGPGVDHLATVLRALARADTVGTDSARVILDGHLLPWLPAWHSAVKRLAMPWPAALADQVLELVLMHRCELGERCLEPAPLAALPDLEAEDTDLRAIARALTTPALAGLFLSRHDLAALARQSRTPTGFGPRAVMLENALIAAATYDTLAHVVGDLRAIYHRWQAELRGLSAREVPGLDGLLAPWRVRTDEAIALLDHIGVAARNAAA